MNNRPFISFIEFNNERVKAGLPKLSHTQYLVEMRNADRSRHFTIIEGTYTVDRSEALDCPFEASSCPVDPEPKLLEFDASGFIDPSKVLAS